MELKKATFILSYSKICLLKHIERSQLLDYWEIAILLSSKVRLEKALGRLIFQIGIHGKYLVALYLSHL